jgi:hypothetical protein
MHQKHMWGLKIPQNLFNANMQKYANNYRRELKTAKTILKLSSSAIFKSMP